MEVVEHVQTFCHKLVGNDLVLWEVGRWVKVVAVVGVVVPLQVFQQKRRLMNGNLQTCISLFMDYDGPSPQPKGSWASIMHLPQSKGDFILTSQTSPPPDPLNKGYILGQIHQRLHIKGFFCKLQGNLATCKLTRELLQKNM